MVRDAEVEAALQLRPNPSLVYLRYLDKVPTLVDGTEYMYMYFQKVPIYSSNSARGVCMINMLDVDDTLFQQVSLWLHLYLPVLGCICSHLKYHQHICSLTCHITDGFSCLRGFYTTGQKARCFSAYATHP